MRPLPSLLVLFFAWLAPPLAAQEHRIINAPSAAAGLPFSSAVRVGNMIYLSGQLGNTPGTRQLADTGIAGQTRQAFENVKAVLAAAGSSMERVVKCTVFLTDIKDYAAMNAVYATYFPKDPPASRAHERRRCRHAPWSRPRLAAGSARGACHRSSLRTLRASGRPPAAVPRPRAGSSRRGEARG